MNIPERVKAFRKEHDLTQKELAKALGVSVRTVENWEQGRTKMSGPALKGLNMIEQQLLAESTTQACPHCGEMCDGDCPSQDQSRYDSPEFQGNKE